MPSRVSGKLNYEKLLFNLRLELFADDTLLKRNPFDALDIEVTFRRQVVVLVVGVVQTSLLVMIGGSGIGLLLLLITVFVLCKVSIYSSFRGILSNNFVCNLNFDFFSFTKHQSGFFRRKKRDQLLQVRQRMTMNPSLFPSNIITGLEKEAND